MGIVILAVITTLTQPEQPVLPAISPSPKPTTGVINNLPSGVSGQGKEAIPYDLKMLNQDYNRLASPAPLSEQDANIKTGLKNQLNNQSGVLFEDANSKIEYVKAPDIFMVEILSENPNFGKQTTMDWFKQQGLSTQGICNLPVMFYLSSQTRISLIESDQKFNPVPEGCQ